MVTEAQYIYIYITWQMVLTIVHRLFTAFSALVCAAVGKRHRTPPTERGERGERGKCVYMYTYTISLLHYSIAVKPHTIKLVSNT